MTPASLRLRLLLIAAPVLPGCSSSPSPGTPATAPTTAVVVPLASAGPARSTEIPYSPLRPTASSNLAAPPPSSWKEGDAVCVRASRTEGERAAMGCGSDLTAEATKEVRSAPDACGHCYFSFSQLATAQSQNEHRDGCCYDVRYPSRGRLLFVDSVERQAAIVGDLAGWGA